MEIGQVLNIYKYFNQAFKEREERANTRDVACRFQSHLSCVKHQPLTSKCGGEVLKKRIITSRDENNPLLFIYTTIV